MTAPTINDAMPPESMTEPALNRDGSVRRKPGPKPGTPRKAKAAPAPGLRTSATATPRRTSSAGVDYRPAILGIMQLPQVALSLAARVVKREETKVALTLDGMTIGLHAPNLAEALNETARTQKDLARILDKLSTVGPWSLVIGAALTPIAQCFANHGVIAPNEQMGILPPDQLVAAAAAAAGIS